MNVKELQVDIDRYDKSEANPNTLPSLIPKTFVDAARMVADPSLADFLADAVTQDGGHHKQWYLEELATHLGIDLPDHEPGIAP